MRDAAETASDKGRRDAAIAVTQADEAEQSARDRYREAERAAHRDGNTP